MNKFLLVLLVMLCTVGSAQASYTFETEYIIGKDIEALDWNSIIIAYQNYTGADNPRSTLFKIYNINGTEEVSEVEVMNDYSIMYYDDLSISVMDSTHFAIVYGNYSGDDTIHFKIYDDTGAEIVGDTLVHTMDTVWETNMFSSAPLNNTHFIVSYNNHWYDPHTGDHYEQTFKIYNDAGVLTHGPHLIYDLRGFFAFGTVISISAFNNTHFGILYDSYGDTFYSICDINGNCDRTTIKNDNGINQGLSISAINSTSSVITYYADGDDTVYYRTITAQGTDIISEVLLESVGSARQCNKVTMINSSNFVFVWHNRTANDTKFKGYDISGNEFLPETNIDINATTYYTYSRITSEVYSTGMGLYGDIFATAWTHNDTSAQFEVFYPNGTVFDGNIIVSAPTNLQNTTDGFNVNFTWESGEVYADSYNVSQNGTWVNGTTATFNNSNVGPHGYSEIIVYVWNDVYGLSEEYVTDNVTVPNNIPSLASALISPSAPNSIDDLTGINGSVTDADGDVITFYYQWYKNGTHQPALDNASVVLADNTSDSEVWKVGIIPYDGYDSGSEVQSATVTIGSGNTAPTLSGITTNVSTKKYGYTVLVSTIDAFDHNNDNYTLHIGTATGLSDLCNSSSTANGSEASCVMTMNWTSGSHILYGRLTDGNDTSIEYTVIISVDNTPPVYVSSGVSTSSFNTGENTSITASITLINGTMDYVKVKVVNINFVSTNYTMSNVNGTWTYVFSPTGAGTYSMSTIYAADDSGNVMSPQSVSHIFTVTDVSGGAGGAGGAAPNITVAGDLTLTPDRRDTYFWYTAISGDRKGVWKFTANRNIETCRVDPNTHATCEIVDGYIVLVTLTVNETVKTYDGTLIVTDDLDYTASSTLVVRVIKLWGSIPIGEINVGPLAMSLSSVFETEETYLIGIRTWVLALIFGLFGLGVYKSFKH